MMMEKQKQGIDVSGMCIVFVLCIFVLLLFVVIYLGEKNKTKSKTEAAFLNVFCIPKSQK